MLIGQLLTLRILIEKLWGQGVELAAFSRPGSLAGDIYGPALPQGYKKALAGHVSARKTSVSWASQRLPALLHRPVAMIKWPKPRLGSLGSWADWKICREPGSFMLRVTGHSQSCRYEWGRWFQLIPPYWVNDRKYFNKHFRMFIPKWIKMAKFRGRHGLKPNSTSTFRRKFNDEHRVTAGEVQLRARRFRRITSQMVPIGSPVWCLEVNWTMGQGILAILRHEKVGALQQPGTVAGVLPLENSFGLVPGCQDSHQITIFK